MGPGDAPGADLTRGSLFAARYEIEEMLGRGPWRAASWRRTTATIAALPGPCCALWRSPRPTPTPTSTSHGLPVASLVRSQRVRTAAWRGDRETLRRMAGDENPRFFSLAEQLATELYAGLGQLEEARIHLFRAASNVLVDLDWLDRCPLLSRLRELPDWDQARKRVEVRAAAVWST